MSRRVRFDSFDRTLDGESLRPVLRARLAQAVKCRCIGSGAHTSKGPFHTASGGWEHDDACTLFEPPVRRGDGEGPAEVRGSSGPAACGESKLRVFNTALISAQGSLTFDEARTDRSYWGRLIESAVGAHLANAALAGFVELFYWRPGECEVDFVFESRRLLTAMEVKTGPASEAQPGLDTFASEFRVSRRLLIGGSGIPVVDFLSKPVDHWTSA